MKKLIFASAAVLLFSAGVAQADMSDNMYTSVLGGWTQDPHLTFGGASPSMNTGFNGGARVGVNLDSYLPSLPGFSLEADGFYHQSHYNASAAKLSSVSFMGDLIYHVPVSSSFSLYGGGGAGGVDDMLDGPVHGDQTVFGWQAIGGLEYAVAPNMSLFTEYRYQNAHDANIGGIKNVGNTSDNASVGVKFNL